MEKINEKVEKMDTVKEMKIVKILKDRFDIKNILLSNTDLKKNDELKSIYLKSWSDLTDEDMKKIGLFESFLKVVKKNTYGKKTKYYAMFINVCDGLTIERRLTKEESIIASQLMSDYFKDGEPDYTKKFYVPLKLTSVETNNKDTGETFRFYNYSTYLCDGIYITSGKKRGKEGRFSDKDIKLIQLSNNKKLTNIQFVDLGFKESKVFEDEDYEYIVE